MKTQTGFSVSLVQADTLWCEILCPTHLTTAIFATQRFLPVKGSWLAHKSAWSMAIPRSKDMAKNTEKSIKNPDCVGKLWLASPKQPNTANFKLGIHLR